MKQSLLILTFIISALIVYHKGNKRAFYYILGTFFIPIFYGGAHLLLPISFLISLAIHSQLKKTLLNYPLTDATLLILAILLVVSFVDERLSIIQSITKSLTYFLNSYIFLYIGFNLINSKIEWRNVTIIIAAILFIYSLYGLFTWYLQSNPFYDYFVEIFDRKGEWSGVQARGYRVHSFLDNPIAYGLVMAVGSFSLFAYYKTYLSKWVLFILLFTVINIVLSNSRSPLMAFFIMVFIFPLFNYGISVKWMFSLFILGFILNVIFISFQDKLSVVVSVINLLFSGEDSMIGSDINLKIEQEGASLSLFYQAPFFGHGINYFQENIASRYGGLSRLYGLEGYGFRMLVEMGGFMIISFLLYIYRFFVSLFNNRKKAKFFASITFVQFLGFLFHIFATGDHGGVFEYCLIMIGINYRMTIITSDNINVSFSSVLHKLQESKITLFR